MSLKQKEGKCMEERTIAVKPKVKWDFLVYIAGDNNLEQAGVRDIEEMKQVGSDDKVNILVECDYVQKDVPSKRYLISKDKSMEEDCVETVGETNTGDPEVLKDFITWSVNSYPADRYALVIWNHGSGWDIPDIFRLVEEERIGEDKALIGRELRTSGGKNVRKVLFRTTLKEILDLPRPLRGIAYDDGSMDCLLKDLLQLLIIEAIH